MCVSLFKDTQAAFTTPIYPQYNDFSRKSFSNNDDAWSFWTSQHIECCIGLCSCSGLISDLVYCISVLPAHVMYVTNILCFCTCAELLCGKRAMNYSVLEFATSDLYSLVNHTFTCSEFHWIPYMHNITSLISAELLFMNATCC